MVQFRRLRLGDQLQVEIATLIQHEVRDPRIGFVTVTEVRMSPDLQYARVYVSILGEESEKQESLDALERARGFLKAQIGKRLRLRYVPELRFVVDNTLDLSERIESLLANGDGESDDVDVGTTADVEESDDA